MRATVLVKVEKQTSSGILKEIETMGVQVIRAVPPLGLCSTEIAVQWEIARST